MSSPAASSSSPKPSSFIDQLNEVKAKYASWLLQHRGLVDQAFLALPMLVLAINNNGSIILNEAAFSVSNLVSMLNDSIVQKELGKPKPSISSSLTSIVPSSPASLLSALKQAYPTITPPLIVSPPLPKLISGLRVLEQIEVVLEMLGEKYNKKWQIISLVEGIKCILRLITLIRNKGSMVIQAPMTSTLPEKQPEPKTEEKKPIQSQRQQQPLLMEVGKRSGRRIPSFGIPITKPIQIEEIKEENNDSADPAKGLASLNQKLDALDEKVDSLRRTSFLNGLSSSPSAAPSAPPPPPEIVEEITISASEPNLPKNRFLRQLYSILSLLKAKISPSNSTILGELLYILRPVLYVGLIRKLGLSSWKPWILSILMDSIANFFSRLARSSSPPSSASNEIQKFSEKDEIDRRSASIAFHAVRSPFFERYSHHWIEWIVQILSKLPIVSSFLATAGIDRLLGLQRYYFYTSP